MPSALPGSPPVAGFLAHVVDRADRRPWASCLKLTEPGVPDIYQGDELWDLALVDPDNRRPVDWERRRSLLDDRPPTVPVSRFTAKLFTTRTLLALRAHFADFTALPYRALDAPDEVCAFERGASDVVVVVPVRPTRPLALPPEVGSSADLVDLLAPLDAVYGARRPGVFVRADVATGLSQRRDGHA